MAMALWGRDQLNCSWCGSLSLFQASLQLWILPNFWSLLGPGHPHPLVQACAELKAWIFNVFCVGFVVVSS